MRGRSILSLDELSTDEVERLLDVTAHFAESGIDADLAGRFICGLFFNPSLRTRTALQVASESLGAHCVIHDVGGTGVNIGHMRTKSPLWADWENPADAPADNAVSNCHIHHCGAELWGAHGIYDAMTKGTRIRHNEISSLPYGGIATGYVWGTNRTSQENCLIELNHVHDVMLKLNDSGCIYTLGFQPGSIIRNNLLHGVRIGGFAGGAVCNNGIFMDEGSKGFLLEGNVIYDVEQAPGARNTPVRFNRSQHDWHTWKDNTIQVEAEAPHAAKELSTKAGLQPEYRRRMKSD